MNQNMGVPASPDIFAILSTKFPENSFFKLVYLWENISYSLLIVLVLGILAFFACRKKNLIPGRLQAAVEVIVGGLDDFVCGILGPKGMGPELIINHDPMLYTPPDPVRVSVGNVHTMYAVQGGPRSW